MRFKILTMLMLSFCLNTEFVSQVQAKKQKSPYEATVQKNGAYVRSGPGKRYYPTMQLKKGTKVTVYRHDPGGWYMIAPPKKSFSWVNAKYVRMVKKNVGEITTNHVTINVGTAFGDMKDVWQRTLSTGDRVIILEEKLLTSSTKKIKYYKIAPPRGEWRWIAGRAVTPENNIADIKWKIDPYQTPPGIKRTRKIQEEYDQGLTFKEKKIQNTGTGKAINQNGPNRQLLAEQTKKMENLDSQFRGIIRKETAQWDFQNLNTEYRQLQKKAASIALSNKLKLRFDALNRYGKIKSQYDDFLRITRETTVKEARLLDLQNKQLNGTSISGGPVPAPEAEFVPETEIVPETNSETPVENEEILEEQSSLPALSSPVDGPALDGPSLIGPALSSPSISQIPQGEIMEGPGLVSSTSTSNLHTTEVATNQQEIPSTYTPQQLTVTQGQTTPQQVMPNPSVNRPVSGYQPNQGNIHQAGSHQYPARQQYYRAPGLLGRLGLIPPRRIPFNQQNRFSSAPQQFSPQGRMNAVPQGQAVPNQGQIQPLADPQFSQPIQQKSAYAPQLKSPHALLDGAGIVNRTPAWRPGSPRYVLTTPDGKILAYLKDNKGVNLEQHVGHAVGVQGQRSHRTDLQSDFIQVNHLTPVELK